jgi:hypothetical protein
VRAGASRCWPVLLLRSEFRYRRHFSFAELEWRLLICERLNLPDTASRRQRSRSESLAKEVREANDQRAGTIGDAPCDDLIVVVRPEERERAVGEERGQENTGNSRRARCCPGCFPSSVSTRDHCESRVAREVTTDWSSHIHCASNTMRNPDVVRSRLSNASLTEKP